MSGDPNQRDKTHESVGTDDAADGEGLSPLAVGYMWCTRIMTIGIEMALIVLLGHWLDGKFGFRPLFTILFAALAMGVSLVHLLAITKNGGNPRS